MEGNHGLWIPRHGFRIQVLDSGFLVGGNWIPDSLSWITNSKPQDSEFHKFPGLPDMGRQGELNKRL